MLEIRGQRSEIACCKREFRRPGLALRGAFTLIELLVVVGIIMVLAGLLLPALLKTKDTARKTKARAEIKQLDMTWKSVFSDYRGWSTVTPGSAANMDNSMVSFLAGGNSKGITYMEFNQGSTNANGCFMDPWYDVRKPSDDTHVYRVYLGANGVVKPYSNDIYRDVAVWSKGPDGADTTAATQADDVRSWE